MKDLAKYLPSKYRHGLHKFVKCQVRHRNIRWSPEEEVRQRVLGFLIREKGWSVGSIELESRINFVDGGHGRVDILLLDEEGGPLLVIECKEEGTQLGEDVKRQAIRYAQSLRSTSIWITNGESHRFFEKVRAGGWAAIDRLDMLKERHRPPAQPTPPADGRGLARFGLSGLRNGTLRDFAVSALKLVLADPKFYRLPWSHCGIHLLEDRGITELSVQTPGGRWDGFYRLFLIATEGRVVTAGIGLRRWGDDRLILCVVFLKGKRKHHALQLQVADFVERDDDTFLVSHNGRMGGRSLKKELVIQALYESCRDDLLDDGGTIHLGRLADAPDKITWRNSRELLGNLLHYALVRTELRESNPYSPSKATKS